jgi:hypothetical protein
LKRIFTLGLLGATLLSLALGAFAEPVKLEYKFKKDDSIKYDVTMGIKLQCPDIPEFAQNLPSNITTSMTQAQRVVEVYEDGSAKVKQWAGNFKMSAPGMPEMPSGQIPDSTTYSTMSKLGKVLSVDLGQPTGTATTPMPFSNTDINKFIREIGDMGAFPVDPVEIGSSWTKNIPIPAKLGSASVKTTMVSSSATCAGMNAVQMTQTMKGSVNVAELIKTIMSTFAAAIPNASQAQIPNFTGTVDLVAASDSFFSQELGKVVGQNGTGKLTVNVVMPQELVQQGAPPKVKFIADFTVNMKKI